MSTSLRSVLPLLSVFPLLAVAGCRLLVPSSGFVAPKPQTISKLTTSTTATPIVLPVGVPNLDSSPVAGSEEAIYLTSLQSTASGKGLVVCEPVGEGITGAEAEFGAGCARWLEFNVSGAPGFSIVPTWGMVDDWRRNQNWSDLKLPQAQAVQLAQGLDVSHVAIATLSKTQGQLTLKYQLLDARKKPGVILKSFTFSGSRDQIASQLPKLGQQMAVALGQKSNIVPAKVELAAPDLALMGRLPWSPNGDPTATKKIAAADQKRLVTLGSQSPLAAIFLGRASDTLSLGGRQSAEKCLLPHLASNTILASELPMNFGEFDTKRQTTLITQLDKQNSKNLGVLLGKCFLHDREGDYDNEVKCAESAVRLAPHCALAWNQLSEALGSQADSLRQAKYWSDMTSSQKSAVEQIYPQASAAAWRAVQLEPGISDFWTTVSSSATFNGEPALAKGALAQALTLNPDNRGALNWGLQIYNPKWYGNAASFLQMADMAVAHADKANINTIAITEGLEMIGQHAQIESYLQQILKKDPNNVAALYKESNILRFEHNIRKTSLAYAKRAAQLAPNNPLALEQYANLLQGDYAKYPQAYQLYLKCTQIEPTEGRHYVNMALVLAKWGKTKEAHAAAMKGHSLGFTGAHPVWSMVGITP